MTTKRADTTHGFRVWLGLLGWIVVCFAAATVGAAFPPDDWYAQLKRPEFAPPNYLFGPVWTVLYLCMAVSAWRIWKSDRLAETWKPLLVFVVQLALNASWTWLFFGLHRMDWALYEIVLLLAAVLVTIAVFWRRDAAAAYLLLPYVLWVVFATALNFEYWRLNR